MTYRKKKNAGNEYPISPGNVKEIDFDPSVVAYVILDNSVPVNGITRVNGTNRLIRR